MFSLAEDKEERIWHRELQIGYGPSQVLSRVFLYFQSKNKKQKTIKYKGVTATENHAECRYAYRINSLVLSDQ